MFDMTYSNLFCPSFDLPQGYFYEKLLSFYFKKENRLEKKEAQTQNDRIVVVKAIYRDIHCYYIIMDDNFVDNLYQSNL